MRIFFEPPAFVYYSSFWQYWGSFSRRSEHFTRESYTAAIDCLDIHLFDMIFLSQRCEKQFLKHNCLNHTYLESRHVFIAVFVSRLYGFVASGLLYDGAFTVICLYQSHSLIYARFRGLNLRVFGCPKQKKVPDAFLSSLESCFSRASRHKFGVFVHFSPCQGSLLGISGNPRGLAVFSRLHPFLQKLGSKDSATNQISRAI